jgi:signal peptidase
MSAISRARWFGQATAVVTLGLSLLLLVAVGVGPLSGRYRVATVLSGSMSPTMPKGSVVFSTPEPASSIAPGQIITFKVPVGDHWVATHRVIEVVSAGPAPVVRTQGDANDAPDPWLARLDGPGPLWRARLAVPKLGYLVLALRHPLLLRFITILAPVLFLLVCLTVIWRRPAPNTMVAGNVGPA